MQTEICEDNSVPYKNEETQIEESVSCVVIILYYIICLLLNVNYFNMCYT